MEKNVYSQSMMTEVETEIIEGKELSPYVRQVMSVQMSDMIKAVALKRYDTGVTDENGHVITTTLAEECIAARLLYMKDHPESFRLDELTRSMDGVKGTDTKEGRLDEANEFFSSVAPGEKEDDDSGTTPPEAR